MPQHHHVNHDHSSSGLNVNAFKSLSRSAHAEYGDAAQSKPEALVRYPSKDAEAVKSSSPHLCGPSVTNPIALMKSTVAHQIRSAQVVLDPAAVIKELLENALDAGATRVDIRVRGKAALDSIAVSDNGKGISKNDYSSICLSASTSKISDFADLDSVSTFGFRGEALSAICTICKSASIVTRTAADTVATSLRFAPDGALQDQHAVARPKGTTVVVDSLFHNLPVRRKDALKNSSREIARCVAVVQALALISVGVRIELKICQDVKVLSQPRPSHSLVSISASNLEKRLDLRELRQNTSCVLGSRTSAALIELPLSEVAAVSLPFVGRKLNSDSPVEDRMRKLHYSCSGLVSKASLDVNGSGGRAKSSYQYIFANRRPVDFPRLTRAIKELYRRTTGLNGASPVLILNLDLPVGSHDVNLSPDKRDFLVRDEAELISGLLQRLETLWAPKKAVEIPLQKLDFCGSIGSVRRSPATTRNDAVLPASMTLASREGVTSGSSAGFMTDQARNTVPLSSMPDRGFVCHNSREGKSSNQVVQDDLDENKNKIYLTFGGELGTVGTVGSSAATGPWDVTGSGETEERCESPRSSFVLDSQGLRGESLPSKDAAKRRLLKDSLCPAKRSIAAFVARRAASLSVLSKKQKSKPSFTSLVEVDKIQNSSAAHHRTRKERVTLAESEKLPQRVLPCLDGPSAARSKRTNQKRSVMKVVWSFVCNTQLQIGREMHLSERKSKGSSNGTKQEAFQKSSVTDPSFLHERFSQAAELEMSRLFRQEWFLNMGILGQFNRGFIVCQLGRDLFIIDQHASDEKYNFEELQRTTVISKQQLVRPLALEFSAQDELIVLQYIDAFRAGGFGIEYRASRKPTQRLYLRSQPVSKHTMFVLDDLKDIVAMLKTAVLHSSSMNVTVLRPPRIRAMLASRACRKSIMIGTALQRPQMERIVRNLASIEHPWTCPHGRPTMRHLCTLPES